MINANNEPESVVLKPSFGRLISHCRKHPNLRLIQLTIEGNPYVLLETNCKILPGEELMYDYGDPATGLEEFMQYVAKYDGINITTPCCHTTHSVRKVDQNLNHGLGHFTQKWCL